MRLFSSPLMRRMRVAATCALFGSATTLTWAQEIPWLVLQVKGDEPAAGQELFDTYLLGGESPASGPCTPQSPAGCLPAQLCPPIEMPSTGIPPAPGEPSPVAPTPAPSTAAQAQPMADFSQAFDSSALLASRDVPVMVGDFFGGGLSTMQLSGFSNQFSQIPDPASGGQFGRIKLAENVSPIPTDRLYLNYSFFKNTPMIPGGLDVNRLSLGFEKTFFDGNFSFEARVPFVGTLGNTLFVDQQGVLNFARTDTSEWQVGNVQLYAKALLMQNSWGAISTGLGISLPTAPDLWILDENGNALMQSRNESVHLLPFIGGVFTPTERCFATSLLQFDFDTTGQPLYSNVDSTGLNQIGKLQDYNFLYFSQGIGYWLVYNNDPGAILQRFSPIAEVHVNTTISDPDTVVDAGQGISGISDSVTVVNGVVGASAVLRNNLRLTVGYVVPLGQSGTPQQFDGELRILVNWYFGRVSPVQQAGFF